MERKRVLSYWSSVAGNFCFDDLNRGSIESLIPASMQLVPQWEEDLPEEKGQ